METRTQTWQIWVVDGNTVEGCKGLCMLQSACPITNGRKSTGRLASVLPDYLLDALGFTRDPDLEKAHLAFALTSLEAFRRRHAQIEWGAGASEWWPWGTLTLAVPPGVHRIRRDADEKGRDLAVREGERDWRRRWDRRHGTIIHTEEEMLRWAEWEREHKYTTEQARLGEIAVTLQALTSMFPVLVAWEYAADAGRARCGACGVVGYTHSTHPPDLRRCFECDERLSLKAKHLALSQRPGDSAPSTP